MINLPHEILPDWESPDASAFRAFLATPTGQKLFPLLLSNRPLLKGDTLETAGLHGKLVEGYELCLQVMSTLCSNQKTEELPNTPSAYPPLDDDAQWNDGLKINESTNNA